MYFEFLLLHLFGGSAKRSALFLGVVVLCEQVMYFDIESVYSLYSVATVHFFV